MVSNKVSLLATDESRVYGGLTEYNHQTVDHSRKQYVIGAVHTNTIESFWALFKRGYHGVYHHMSKKHLQRYVDEFTFRFNRRAREMETVFSDVVLRVAGSERLTYKQLTGKI